MIIAQRFLAGETSASLLSPGGTVEWRIQPSLRDFTVLRTFPSDKSLGYYHPSLTGRRKVS